MAKLVSKHTFKMAGWIVGLVWCIASGTVWGQGDLQTLKSAYAEQVGNIRTDSDAQLKDLNQQYLQNLQALDAQFKRAGDLDNVLATHKELQRFKASGTLAPGDVAETPADLAALQRGTVRAQAAIGKDREARLARLTTAYTAQLDQLKRKLTQQDDTTAALAVQQELDQVRGSSEVPPSAETRPQPQTGEMVAPGTGTLPALRPPKGSLWVLASDNGSPARGISFFFQTEPDGRVIRDNTDTSGKVSFRAENATTYRLVLVSDKYNDVDMPGLKEGETYTVTLQLRGPNDGVVELRNRQCQLPEIGRLIVVGSWMSDNGEQGFSLRAESPRVKVQSNFSAPSFANNGIRRNTFANEAFLGGNDRAVTFQLGEIKCEVKAVVIGERTFLSYKRL